MIHRKYGITISATISSIAYGIEELNRLYEEVLEFSNYRMFQGKGCIIKADAVRVKPADEYSYPVVKEKELIDALMLGNMDRAEELLLQIIEETAGYPYTILNLAVLRIFTAIHNATHIIRKHNNITAHLNLGTLMADIKRCETVEDIIQQFHRVFQTITAYVEQVKNNKHEDLIHKVSVIISEKFSDPNLSLNYIADSVNLSAAYLGRLIKKTKSESVSDMINNYRLDKAKELLEKTQHPVHAITETIGITNEPYFYTLFKKKFGVTPNEYRRNIYPESIP
jgi:YesN/AraC family two-component response regulator